MFDVWFSLYNIHWNSLKDVKKNQQQFKYQIGICFRFPFEKSGTQTIFLFKSFPFYAEINLFLNWKSPLVFVIHVFIDIPVFIIIKEHWFIDQFFYPNYFFYFFFLQSFPFYSEIHVYFFNWKFPLGTCGMMTINAYNNRTLLNKFIELNLIM